MKPINSSLSKLALHTIPIMFRATWKYSSQTDGLEKHSLVNDPLIFSFEGGGYVKILFY